MIVTYDSRIVIWGIFKTCICCAWDSNPEQQDSRCRRIHWAIAAAPWETNLEMFQFYWPQLFIQRRERVGLREKSSHSFSVHFGPMLDARSIKLNETFSLLESNSNDNKWKLIKIKLNPFEWRSLPFLILLIWEWQWVHWSTYSSCNLKILGSNYLSVKAVHENISTKSLNLWFFISKSCFVTMTME